ncbi:uncharacterized protein LOC129595758 [Paramacrobiotus metropolitanus]|uniref:uncharacterized protein LOC129595758 n=1 Tax=Paramacrobiotus metropolitanus TaxID=2943436 RepID=UPI0024462DE1|nr:uncharacterized protein LOC129595758 [Paramacrobiotus metropolitanus]
MATSSLYIVTAVQLWLVACQILGRTNASCTFNRGESIPVNFECRVQYGSAYGRLTFQPDGNLVIYDGSGLAKWSTGTAGRAERAVFQSDGNFVIYDIAEKAVWNSHTAGKGRILVFQNDRNLVIYDNASKSVWNSKTYVTCK